MGSGGGRGELSRHYDGGSISAPGFSIEHTLPPAAEETTEAIDSAIEARLSMIQPAPEELRRMKSLKSSIEGQLAAELDVERVNVVGSVAKGTQIHRPGGNDIDVEVVLGRESHGDWLDQESGARNCLSRVRDVIARNPRFDNVEVRVDRNVVRARLGQATLDIAPAFSHPEGGVVIPDTSGAQGWVRTNPRMSKRLLEAADRARHGQVVPLIQLAKDWSLRNGDELRSYTIEAMVTRFFAEKEQNGENTSRANVHEFFARLPWLLQKGAATDPVYGQPADTYLEPETRSKLIARAVRTATKLDRAERLARAGKADRASEIYRDVLGG